MLILVTMQKRGIGESDRKKQEKGERKRDSCRLQQKKCKSWDGKVGKVLELIQDIFTADQPTKVP